MASNKGLYHYDFNNWVLNLNGFTINRGVTSVEVAYNADSTSSTVSIDGTVTRNRINDESATVTLVVNQTSPVNGILLDQLNGDKAAPNGLIGTLSLEDPTSGHRFFAQFAWVQDRGDLSLEQESSDRTWVLATNCLIETAPSEPIAYEYRTALGPLGQ